MTSKDPTRDTIPPRPERRGFLARQGVTATAAFFSSVVEGTPYGATIDDAVAGAVALEAISESARTRRWTPISPCTS